MEIKSARHFKFLFPDKFKNMSDGHAGYIIKYLEMLL